MDAGRPSQLRAASSHGCCCSRVHGSSKPTYPYIKVPCRNGASYFIQFTLEVVPCARAFRTAQLITSTVNEGQPVLIRIDSIDPPVRAPWTKTCPLTCTAQEGATMPAGVPCTFSVYNATAPGPNSTFVWGCTEYVIPDSSGAGTLTYALPVVGVVPSPETPEPTSLRLTPCTTPAPPVLTTGVRNCVMSQDGRALRAVPTIDCPDVFQLMLVPVGDTRGFAVTALALFSADACDPAATACDAPRRACCCSAAYP